MSSGIADITLTLNTASTLPINNVPLSYIKWLVLLNTSPFACHASLGGYTFTIPAWYFYPVALRDDNGALRPGVSMPFTITPYLQTIPGVGFTSILHAELYMVGEDPPQTQPMPLGGGPINLSIATSVVNTGGPPFTSIVYGLPSGDSNNTLGAVNIENSGFIQLGDSVYQGQMTVSGPDGKSTTITNDNVETPTLTVDATATVTGNLVANGGMNINTIRDDVNGNTALDLSAGDGTVALPQILKPNAAGTVHNGSVSGTATLYTPVWGASLKIIMLVFSNYQSAATFTFSLPGTITFGNLLSGNFGAETVTPQFNGVASNGSAITALASGGGTFVGVGNIAKGIIGELAGATNQLLISSNAAAVSRMLLIIGV